MGAHINNPPGARELPRTVRFYLSCCPPRSFSHSRRAACLRRPCYPPLRYLPSYPPLRYLPCYPPRSFSPSRRAACPRRPCADRCGGGSTGSPPGRGWHSTHRLRGKESILGCVIFEQFFKYFNIFMQKTCFPPSKSQFFSLDHFDIFGIYIKLLIFMESWAIQNCVKIMKFKKMTHLTT